MLGLDLGIGLMLELGQAVGVELGIRGRRLESNEGEVMMCNEGYDQVISVTDRTLGAMTNAPKGASHAHN
ncbi:hypothetical protein V6N13_005134 [Hibiscus sabdariffa]